jgi:predicted phosphodiesterase
MTRILRPISKPRLRSCSLICSLTLLLIGCGYRPPAVITPPAQPTVVPSTQTATPVSSPTPSPTPTPDVFAAEFPLGDVAYLLPLTIRHVTPTSAQLFFELDRPVAGYLFYQLEGGSEGGRVALPRDTARYQLTLQNLRPGTTYRIRVGIPDDSGGLAEPRFLGGRWGPLTVHTQAQEGALRFAVIGDASFGDPVTAALVGRMAQADLDFVLHTGDVVDETAPNANPFESYEHKYYETFAPLLQHMPIYTVPGNHDYDADIRWQGEPFYFEAFPPFADPLIHATGSNQYYAFSEGRIQFIMLDSQVFFGVAGRQEEQNWLAERLADDRFQAAIPVLHVSPFSSSAVHRNEGLPIRQSWVPLFEAAHVPVVFSGHTHQYERLKVNGIAYIVSGGGSAVTYAQGALLPESQVFARKSHFVLAELYPNRLDLTSLSVDGETIDQASIPLPAPSVP